jgi:hypothetical protein
MSPVLEGLINDPGLTANGVEWASIPTPSVILTKWGGDDGDWFARAEPA